MRGVKAPIEERFWEKVIKTDGCWIWTASVRGSNGYGQIGGVNDGGPYAAHRLSWVIHNGSIPEGMSVLHRCDNPICVRPDHLWLGTVAENNADRKAKGRNADMRGQKAAAAKLSEAQVLAIRQDKRLQREIAADYGILQGHVSRLKSGARWGHVV